MSSSCYWYLSFWPSHQNPVCVFRMRATCSVSVSLLDFFIVAKFSEEYRLCSLCNFGWCPPIFAALWIYGGTLPRTMIQVGRSRVRDPMRWIFSIYLILPATIGPGVCSVSNRNEYQKQKNIFSGSRARLVPSGALPDSFPGRHREQWAQEVTLTTQFHLLSRWSYTSTPRYAFTIWSSFNWAEAPFTLSLLSELKSKRKVSKANPWRPIGLWDVKDPTLSRQSAHRWR
jgi:hypothetical protein